MRLPTAVKALAGALLALVLTAAPAAAVYDRDFDGDGEPDVVAADTTGRLLLYPADGSGGWRPSRQIGRGWSLLDEIRIAGDWDGDGDGDVLARSIVTGDLLLYPGDGAGGFRAPRQVGSGWRGFADVLTPGDWDGDEHPDVLGVRRDDGTLWLYPGDGSGGWQQARRVGTGWLGLDLVTPVGDWDGDGDADLVARAPSTSDLWLYPGDGSGSFTSPRVIGSQWQGFTALIGPGDWDGDGANDLLGRDGRGRLILYRGDGAGGFRSRPYPVVGTGWNSLLLNEPTQSPRRVLQYSVRALGSIASDAGYFRRHVNWTLNDPRGWSLGRDIRFDEVSSGGDFTLYLASPQEVDAAAPGCSAQWSCRVGNSIYINDDRWRNATSTYAGRPLTDYRHYVVNHEVGHWFELGHWSCPGRGQPAPVMQQQSISLDGCTTNVWPVPAELREARDFAF